MATGLLHRGRAWAVLAAPSAILFTAHTFHGAFLPIPALFLTVCGATLLVVALLSPAGQDLAGLSGLRVAGALFATMMFVGLWSLTSWTPGGPHPLWTWAGAEEGAATIDRSATRIELLKMMGLACFFVVGCLMGARSDRARRAVIAMLVVGAIWAFGGLITFLVGAQRSSGPRLDGGFATANSAGTVLGVLLVIASVWSLVQWRRSRGMAMIDRVTRAAPGLAMMLLFAACLLLTGSRAAVGATILAIVLVGLCSGLQTGRCRPVRALATTLLALAALTTYAAVRTPFLDRLDRVGADDQARRILLDVHWQAFLDSALTGHGLGTYVWVNNQLTTAETYDVLSATVVLHNAPVQWLEEAGLLGTLPMFLLILWILGLTIVHAFRRRSNRLLLTGLIATNAVVVVHSLADVSLQTPSIAALWALLLGLGFAASQASARR